MKKSTIPEFATHKMERSFGWSWRLAKPGTSHYAFRVTWTPYNLIVTGDIGSIIVTHYSFNDPWSAAAWVSGADWDHFMSKTNVARAYDPQATAECIVETAYQRLRDDRDHIKLFEKIFDEASYYGSADATNPTLRKAACREFLTSDLLEHTAYEITNDSEMLSYRYPENSRWQYTALQLWARTMWETEPAWHKVLRTWRQLRAGIKDLKRSPVVFGPVLYAKFDERGRIVQLNGAKLWVWKARPDGSAVYHSVYPLRVAGRDLSRFGLYRRGFTGWNDERGVDSWGRAQTGCGFRDVRASDLRAAA